MTWKKLTETWRLSVVSMPRSCQAQAWGSRGPSKSIFWGFFSHSSFGQIIGNGEHAQDDIILCLPSCNRQSPKLIGLNPTVTVSSIDLKILSAVAWTCTSLGSFVLLCLLSVRKSTLLSATEAGPPAEFLILSTSATALHYTKISFEAITTGLRPCLFAFIWSLEIIGTPMLE